MNGTGQKRHVFPRGENEMGEKCDVRYITEIMTAIAATAA
jgi:hypothetical protein